MLNLAQFSQIEPLNNMNTKTVSALAIFAAT